MKPIKYFLLGMFLTCTHINSTAQYIYTHGIDTVAQEITFDVRVSPYTIYLKNTANELIDKPITWVSGIELTKDEYNALTLGIMDQGGLRKAIRETFSEAEYAALKNGKDYIELFTVINADGQILELVFYIHKSTRTETLSPDKYELLEQNLKLYATYSITDDMQKLSFWRSFHLIDFASLGILYKNQDPGIALPDSLQVNP